MAQETILIADDEPDVLDLCRYILVAEGYQIETVPTGYAALERIKQQPFDLLLTDIRMPGMDGLATAQAAKQINPSLICVAMTGHGSMDTAIQALKLGIDEFLVKPFTPTELSMSIAKALEKERLHKENIRLRSLIPLFEFNKTLLSTVEVEALLHRVLQLAHQETQADLAMVFLNDLGEMSEHMQPASPESDGQNRPLRVELARWIMQHQQYLSLRRGEPLQPRFQELLEALDIEFLVGLPFVANEGQSLGALILGKRAAPFAASDSEFLQVLGGQAAIGIENAHLFRKIQQAYDELKKLDHLKSEFINIAAHELRTPLSILLGYASVMQDEADQTDRARLDVIVRNATRLSILVDDMLNLNYLETGQAQIRIDEVSLQEVFQEAILDVGDMAKEKTVNIEFNIPGNFPLMLTDRQKLDLIVMHLLSNAIKYSPPSGLVSIEASLNGDKAVIAVRDRGIGIPLEEQDKIFERFYQVEDSLTRQYGGIGLGLAIVKRLVELCQGRIWVESQMGKGSTFTFELPLELSEQPPT
jgi:signal transduction histidine kinase/FixJ family two-component response regulator